MQSISSYLPFCFFFYVDVSSSPVLSISDKAASLCRDCMLFFSPLKSKAMCSAFLTGCEGTTRLEHNSNPEKPILFRLATLKSLPLGWHLLIFSSFLKCENSVHFTNAHSPPPLEISWMIVNETSVMPQMLWIEWPAAVRPDWKRMSCMRRLTE